MVRDTRDTWSITRTRWDMGLGTIGGVMEQPPGGSHHGYLVRERLHLEHLPWHCLPGAVDLFIHHPEALVQAAGDPNEDPAASRPPEETLVPGGGLILGRGNSFLGRVPPNLSKNPPTLLQVLCTLQQLSRHRGGQRWPQQGG